MKNKKIVIGICAAVLVVIVAIIIYMVISINKYIDTHTWATITIDGVVDADTSDAYYEQHEYLQGDIISISGTYLEITDITHDGSVTFRVVQGTLKDNNGTDLETGTLTLKNKVRYIIGNGNISLEVTNNRYQ